MATFNEWIHVYRYIDLCRRAGILQKEDVKRIAEHLIKAHENER